MGHWCAWWRREQALDNACKQRVAVYRLLLALRQPSANNDIKFNGVAIHCRGIRVRTRRTVREGCTNEVVNGCAGKLSAFSHVGVAHVSLLAILRFPNIVRGRGAVLAWGVLSIGHDMV
eukprot:COSAG05_NODE_3746_length_1864_cov_4.547631_1_plen_119_part_00